VQANFALVDVFTRQSLAGSTLVVFPHAHGLSEPTMKAVAREFRHAETTFDLHSLNRKAAGPWFFTPAGGQESARIHASLLDSSIRRRGWTVRIGMQRRNQGRSSLNWRIKGRKSR
jgi:hypothetical protein